MNEVPCLAGLLLAAGASSRLGRPKQLVEIEGRSLVRRAVQNWLDLELDGVQILTLTVVTGCQASDVDAQLSGLPVRVEHCPGWSSGMGASLAHGAGLAPENADGLMILLCDQWRLDSARLAALATAWRSDISTILASRWVAGESISYGPPCIFPRQIIHELECINKKHGARSVIDRHLPTARFLRLDEAAFDLDTKADLASALRMENQP